MDQTFRIYKGEEKIVEGSSPLTITGLEPSTIVSQGTYQVTRVLGERESTRTDLPFFTTLSVKERRILTVNGEERTGDYYVLEIYKEDNLAKQDNSSENIYRVQPRDTESGRVYFLGSVPIDVSKKDDVFEYTRNYYLNSSGEWKEVTYSGWAPSGAPYSKTLEELQLKVGDVVSSSTEYENNSTMSITTELRAQKSSGRVTASSTEVAPSNSGTSVGEITIPEGTVSIGVTPGAKGDNTTSVSIRYRKVKLFRGNKQNMCGFTIAPEDILLYKISQYNALTVKQLKQELDKKNIEYARNAKKEELINLLT